jgi:hypothetical protein
VLVSNFLRFGSALEFGYNLNLYGFPVWYFTRFYCPFSNESLIQATRELFGALFFVKRLNGFDNLQEDFFWGQSALGRWRQFYMTTFDWNYLILLLTGGAVVAIQTLRQRRRGNLPIPKGILAAGIWSLISSVILAGFYLKSPVIASRYVLDFSASFAVAIFSLILFTEASIAGKSKIARYLPQTLFWILIIWGLYRFDRSYQ